MSVADYCHAFNNGKIKVNDEYQRNSGLWTAQARSFFIESILLEYPIPKLYLHARLDLKSRQQVKEVVDGQQRTQALVSFFNNKQRLTSNIDTSHLRGLRYNQLDDEWKTRFLSYSLPIDQFSGAPDEEIREAFRRMNANNIPLNDEEQRNARYQGPFKWFILRIADRFQSALSRVGLFSRRDLIRMSDLKVYAEIALALDGGFSTVKGKQLDDLYKKYNAVLPVEDELDAAISRGVEAFLERPSLHLPVFLRAHVFQSIVLALIAQTNQELISRLLPSENDLDRLASLRLSGINMSVLADALSDSEGFPTLQEFSDAVSKKTNVEGTKRLRFIYFTAALGGTVDE
jgi:hypothetical protein